MAEIRELRSGLPDLCATKGSGSAVKDAIREEQRAAGLRKAGILLHVQRSNRIGATAQRIIGVEIREIPGPDRRLRTRVQSAGLGEQAMIADESFVAGDV